MDEMRELITVEAFGRGLVIASAAWVVIGLAVTLVRRGSPNALHRGLAWTMLGILVPALWALYSWMVRVDPDTGYVGLHRVSVFAASALVFIAVGIALGYLFARLYRNNTKDGA